MSLKATHLEPGFLQVFRIYAWVRLVSILMIPLAVLRRGVPGTGRDRSFPLELPLDFSVEPGVELVLPLTIMVLNIVILVLYLYLPLIQDRLGGFFALGAIILGALDLILGQQLLNSIHFFGQLSAFSYILLILVAWQYNFRQVLLFTIGFTVLDGLLYILFPVPGLLGASELNPERWVLLWLLFRAVSFLVLGYVVTRLVIAQREQRRALAEANQKLVQHAATLEQLTISRERIRLSRELHDTLAHTLSALAVQIDAVMAVWEPIPAKARTMLEEMLGTTRSGLDETRRALGALRASPLEEMGLAVALRAFAEDFAARNAAFARSGRAREPGRPATRGGAVLLPRDARSTGERCTACGR